MTAGEATPSRWHEAEIEKVVRATPRIVSVFLKAPIARHVAGQHLDVRLTAPDGYEAQRSYSIASAPGEARVELLIEKLDDGEVSPYFHEVARAGDTFDVRGPLGGHFIWRAQDGGPVLLVAGGSGIAPLMAIVRDWARERVKVPLLLAYSVRTWEELAFRDELIDLEARHPDFRFIVTTTRGPEHRIGDLHRRLNAASIREILTHWKQAARHVYVCGSNRFVEAVSAGLLDASLPASIIRTERYGGAD
ncbi:FAD-binding oxidoreductase [Variovorax sp. J2P1-59]|uniref:FAD-binding oxidoreductase n=1 Tax=Variovorax flavidus TaxID=3053501 RepID=UPI002576D868|nr:FAD-binding oxidoreductase [Variovorax sp. J2P1-59]MDM0076958.1 FAD-binding oxidoreductase [Variovorax sp. J2P1-59]